MTWLGAIAGLVLANLVLGFFSYQLGRRSVRRRLAPPMPSTADTRCSCDHPQRYHFSANGACSRVVYSDNSLPVICGCEGWNP